MAWLPAGFTDGGPVTGEMLRRATSIGARGETSIIRPKDLKVVQTNPPSAAVTIRPGSAVISGNRYTPGRDDQVYLVTNDAAETYPVPANTTQSPMTRHVCVVPRDPQYAGGGVRVDETDTMTDVVIGAGLPNARPYIWLAQIVIPPNTAAITDEMISEPLFECRPFELQRTVTDVEIKSMPTSDPYMNMSKTAFRSWPLTGWSVNVPPWATKLILTVTVGGTEYTGSDRGTASLKVVFDTMDSEIIPISSNGLSRQVVMATAKFNVPEAIRGHNSRYIGLQGMQASGTGNWQQDSFTTLEYRWVWTEEKE